MKVNITDRDALVAVSPAALAAYARAAGWAATEPYGDFAYVYTSEDHPEIIIPQTQRVADYAQIVRLLIEAFAEVSELDQLAIYRDLVTADRDVIRVRAAGSEDGHVSVNAGVDLVQGARDMVLAAACSVQHPRAVYRPGANLGAKEFVDRMRLGQTEEGSFVVSLLGPVVPPVVEPSLGSEFDGPDNEPIERRMTMRVAEAVTATRDAAERTNSGDTDAFSNAVTLGASANLCEALVLLIEPFVELDVSVSWALTRPKERRLVRFGQSDAPVLREASRAFRLREPHVDVEVSGFVQRLKRDVQDPEGTVTLRGRVDGAERSVTAVLPQTDYETAMRAHEARAMVVAKGDLERVGQRWQLLHAQIVGTVESTIGDLPDHES